MHFNLADLFESLVDVLPDRIAAVVGDQRLSFRELDERANRLANALAARGVGAGSHLGLYLYNGVEYVEVMLAALKLRAVPININFRYVESELEYLVRNADLVALFYSHDLGPRVAAVKERSPALRLVVSAGGEPIVGGVAYEELVAEGSPERKFEPRSGDDLFIIYTGGTTGMPRGVMWRHEDMFYAGLQGGSPGGDPILRAEDLAPTARDRDGSLSILSAAPFIHGTAQWGAWIAWFSGGPVVLAPGKSYDAKAVCKLIEREKVNTLVLVGDAMVRPLADALDDPSSPLDMSSLMVISSSGAILSDALKDQLQEKLPHTMILNNFGASEAGHQGRAFSQGGRTVFFMDETNTVLDENNKPVAPGSGVVGRLARKGRIPVGYYNDPEKTAATFVTADGERWVIPGDLATIDEDGLITVLGRGAVCINSGGEKIFPEEVESVLKAHPAIEDALVVGVPDERWGQRVAAVVEPRRGADVTLDLIDAHCRASLAGYKVPRLLHVADRIARHPSGKPDYAWAKAAVLGQKT